MQVVGVKPRRGCRHVFSPFAIRRPGGTAVARLRLRRYGCRLRRLVWQGFGFDRRRFLFRWRCWWWDRDRGCGRIRSHAGQQFWSCGYGFLRNRFRLCRRFACRVTCRCRHFNDRSNFHARNWRWCGLRRLGLCQNPEEQEHVQACDKGRAQAKPASFQRMQ